MLEGDFSIRSERVPSDLHPELATDQLALEAAFSTAGLDVPPEKIGTDDVYFMLTWWVRIYGHVALEVFGRFPFALDDADRLFDSLLGELGHDLGLDRSESGQHEPGQREPGQGEPGQRESAVGEPGGKAE